MKPLLFIFLIMVFATGCTKNTKKNIPTKPSPPVENPKEDSQRQSPPNEEPPVHKRPSDDETTNKKSPDEGSLANKAPDENPTSTESPKKVSSKKGYFSCFSEGIDDKNGTEDSTQLNIAREVIELNNEQLKRTNLVSEFSKRFSILLDTDKKGLKFAKLMYSIDSENLGNEVKNDSPLSLKLPLYSNKDLTGNVETYNSGFSMESLDLFLRSDDESDLDRARSQVITLFRDKNIILSVFQSARRNTQIFYCFKKDDFTFEKKIADFKDKFRNIFTVVEDRDKLIESVSPKESNAPEDLASTKIIYKASRRSLVSEKPYDHDLKIEEAIAIIPSLQKLFNIASIDAKNRAIFLAIDHLYASSLVGRVFLHPKFKHWSSQVLQASTAKSAFMAAIKHITGFRHILGLGSLIYSPSVNANESLEYYTISTNVDSILKHGSEGMKFELRNIPNFPEYFIELEKQTRHLQASGEYGEFGEFIKDMNIDTKKVGL